MHYIDIISSPIIMVFLEPERIRHNTCKASMTDIA